MPSLWLTLLALAAARPLFSESVPTPAPSTPSLAFERSIALQRYGAGVAPTHNLLTSSLERVRLEVDGVVAVTAPGDDVLWTVEDEGAGAAGGPPALDVSDELRVPDSSGGGGGGGGGDGDAGDGAPLRALVAAELCGSTACAPAALAWRGGATVALRTRRPGRATLCARWAGLRACATVRVQPRLVTAPTGVLRLVPSAHVRLRLWRLHEVGGEEEEVALPTSTFLFLTGNPRVLSLAMHHGRLDAIAVGESKLIAVDVGAREAEASPDVRHAQYCGGEAWRAPPGIDECPYEEELSGGLVRSVIVELPVAAVLWAEPAAWPSWLAAGDEEEEQEATAPAADAVMFPHVSPDDDYDGGVVAPRCISPLVIGSASAGLPASAFAAAAAAASASPRTRCPRLLPRSAAGAWAALAPLLSQQHAASQLPERRKSAALHADGIVVEAAASDRNAVRLACDAFGELSACRVLAAPRRGTSLVRGRRYELRAQLAAAGGGRMLAGTNVRFMMTATCTGGGAAVLITPGPPPVPARLRDGMVAHPHDAMPEPHHLACDGGNSTYAAATTSTVRWPAVSAALITAQLSAMSFTDTRVRLQLLVQGGHARLLPVAVAPADALSTAAALSLSVVLNDVRQRLSQLTWQAPPLAAHLDFALVDPLTLRYPHSRRHSRRGRGDRRDITVAVHGIQSFPLIFSATAPLAFSVTARSPGVTARVTEAGDVELGGAAPNREAVLVAVHTGAPENGLLLRLRPRLPVALVLAPAAGADVATVLAVAALVDDDGGGELQEVDLCLGLILEWSVAASGTLHAAVLSGGKVGDGRALAAAHDAAAALPDGLPLHSCGVAIFLGIGDANITVALRGDARVQASARVSRGAW